MKRLPLWMVVATGAWAGGLVLCGKALLSYSYTPAKAAPPPLLLPMELRHDPNDPRLTLIMFAHPHCPCTRASLAELARALAGVHSPPDIRIIFCKPLQESEDWMRGWNWDAAHEIAGTSVMIDSDGALARACHAGTSGQTLLFDSAGRLLFNGGITPGRGHEGDNPGREALAAMLRGQTPRSFQSTPVFGCPLLDDASAGPSACRVKENGS